MDLETFLALEKRRLAEERQDLYEQTHILNSLSAETNNSVASMRQQPQEAVVEPQPNGEDDDTMSKQTKDWINQQYNNKKPLTNETTAVKERKKKNQDDMEQWVSDTFYSYFPGFSNEYQKRQNDLQKRQKENQENLIKHQMLHSDRSRKKKPLNMDLAQLNSARSNTSSLTSNANISSLNHPQHANPKTDLEIINVNNPNYVPSKHSAHNVRPDSARYRLLQDLRHTNLTNLINGNGEDAMELNKRQAELESARKKEYQRELMQQIEEKRRTIKLLRDKEHQQEEVLTRRLQEQLKTMKLEEQLEKERLKAVKVRFDAEQNRLNREHLLAKLENDSQLLLNTELNTITSTQKPPLNNETNKENIANRQDNKVYKYFSNSEKHEYNYRNKSSSLATEIDFELEPTEMAKIERECFHLSEKICPMCDEPLKELDNFCLRCQNKISFRIRSPSKGQDSNGKSYTNKKSETKEASESDRNSEHMEQEQERSFFLICTRCERLYSWCKSCTTKTDVCKACQNKRNLCMSCRKTLCSFCLEEVACGKDAESLHINDSENALKQNSEPSKEFSFQVRNDIRDSVRNDNKSSNISSLSPEYTSLNNLDEVNHPPYSMNIEQNSLFHPDNNRFSMFSKQEDTLPKSPPSGENNLSFYDHDHFLNTSSNIVDDKNIERLRRDTDKRLLRYLKNYGDLAYQTRGTQTTPTSTGRRDVVLQGEHSLSIPLMREMPKMTRMEAVKFKENSRELEDLQRRWDIPAVQKYSVSSVSPKVVTQVGAIRKQLQIDRMFSEETDS